MATHSKRALVTGAGGFTGVHLCQYLTDQGVDVVGLQHRPVASEPDLSWRVMSGDILDEQRMSEILTEIQPDYIFHLAAIAFVAHGDPVDIYKVNVLGTEALLKSIAKACPEVERVVLASSANIYGNPKTSPVLETAIPAPVNHYGCSKLSMELIARNYFHQLPITMARPFNYTGPGQDPKYLVPKMVAHFRDKKSTIELGNIEVTRDISDVRDIVRYYLALAQNGETSSVYNLCGGKGYKLVSIIEHLQEICGYKIDITVNPAFVRASDISVLVGDRARLAKIAADRPSFDLTQTLTDMLQH